jgi:radical SAM superfamily enzyme YgiQ (UPF0313 family)
MSQYLPVRVLLISTYDMGRQPFGLASAAASLQAAGVETMCADVAKERLGEEAVRAADLIAFFLPMHTATRLALPVIERVRALNRSARLCAYGLYAPLNAELLRERGIEIVIGGEFEDELAAAAMAGLKACATTSAEAGVPGASADAAVSVPRVRFRIPLRETLPPLSRYAALQLGDERRTVGYTEASRGCKHRCRHCPIVPVYDGRFRIVPEAVVLADVRAQVAAGARHITFGDPDFFNGPGHAAAVVRAVARECPGISYDVTIKVEHLLRHADFLPVLRETGCAFVTSAVESIDDAVLEKLEKGHTAADFERAVALCRASGVPLAPTFVAFTPWTTLEGYCALLQAIDRLDLIDHVAPIQLAIRLLIPQGSRLLELPDIRATAGPFDASSLSRPWRHPDPRVDELQARVQTVVGMKLTVPRREVFERVWAVAHDAAGLAPVPRATQPDVLPRAAVPYLNEPWYC